MSTTETPTAEYTEKVEDMLADARRRFQRMELEQMKKGEVEARAVLARAQERFEKRRAELESRLKKAGRAGGSVSDELEAGIEKAWSSLESSMERARAEFAGEAVEDDTEDEAER